jgi:hypothetical protein
VISPGYGDVAPHTAHCRSRAAPCPCACRGQVRALPWLYFNRDGSEWPLEGKLRMAVGSWPPLESMPTFARKALLQVLGVLGAVVTHRRGACASRARGRWRGRLGDFEGS